MFNLQGSEIIFILLLALVVLGPEKLPSAIRRFTQTYAELRKMGTGFQTELKSALDEPMREMKETAGLLRDAADPTKIVADAEAATTAAVDAERDAERKLRAQEILDQRSAHAVESTDDDTASEQPETSADNTANTVDADDDDDVDEWADPIDSDEEQDQPVADSAVTAAAHEAVATDDVTVAENAVAHDVTPIAEAASGDDVDEAARGDERFDDGHAESA